MKNKRIKEWDLNVTGTLRWSFEKSGKAVNKAWLINSLKLAPSNYANSIQSSALPKIPLTIRSPRMRIFQEDEYTHFAALDTISKLNYTIK